MFGLSPIELVILAIPFVGVLAVGAIVVIAKRGPK
jgi:hypothetical protein